MSAPVARPSDGLLTDAELQEVVDRQVERNTEALVRRLAHERAAVRARAALALGSVQSPEAVPALTLALSDSDAGVRRDAAFALGQAGQPDAVPALAQALGGEGDGQVRAQILQALAKLPTPPAALALLEYEALPDEEAARVLALARLGAVAGVSHPDAVRHLVDQLTHEDPGVRESSAYYFSRVPDAAPWAARAPRVREALDSYERDDPAAMYLVSALAKLRDVTDEIRIVQWAPNADDWRTRANAMAALQGRERSTFETLLDGLDDESIHVAVSAAQVLAEGPSVPSVPGRVRAWIEAHPDRVPVVAPLLVLLARANESEFVLEWLDAVDPDDAPRLSAGLAALAYLPGEEAIERLAGAAASTSPRMHADGVEALALRWVGERDDVSLHAFFLEIFSRALRGDNARAAYAAAAALSDSVLQPLGGVDTLVAAYRRMRAPDDLEPMLSIVGSLDIAGSPAAETLLRETLGHPHPVLRRAAAQALASLIVRGVLPQTAGAPLPRPPGSDAAPAGLDGADHTRIDWAYLAELGPRPRLVLETERGRVALHLVTEDAPHTVQTIARLVEAGRYDGSTFHRVPPNFVAQGGDFERGDGFGGPGFTITTELNLVPFLRGVIGMASAGKDTEGSQFFITHSMQPHLDGGYTTFGWVVEGMEVVDLIAAGDRVVRASIERGG